VSEPCTQADQIRNIAEDLRELKASNVQIREKLFNGISDAIKQIPDIRADVTEIKSRQSAPDSKGVVARRAVDASVMGIILAAITQWDSIVAFLQRLFGG